VSTPVSLVVVYVPSEVVAEADFPTATEEARAQTDWISSRVNGLVKRGFLGTRVISPFDRIFMPGRHGYNYGGGAAGAFYGRWFGEDDGLLSR
jgi:hypothetical protein